MKILIAVPTFENIAPETFKSIYDLKKIPDGNFDFEFIKGYDCARARNAIAKKAIDGGYDRVLMVDSDIILPSDALLNLNHLNMNIVFGYYPSKSNSDVCEAFKYSNNDGYPKEDKIEINYIKDALSHTVDRFQIKGSGFGCAYIKTEIFKYIPYPYFNYVNYTDGGLLSEDLYFCSQARDSGYDLFLDTRVKCKHIGRKIL